MDSDKRKPKRPGVTRGKIQQGTERAKQSITPPKPGARTDVAGQASRSLSKDRLAENARRRAANRANRSSARAQRAAQPLPPPPPRRAAGRAPAQRQQRAAAANEALTQQLTQLQDKFVSLDRDAQLSQVYNDISRIEMRLTELPLELDALRGRGYLHSGRLEDRIDAFDQHWDEVRPRVEAALRQNVRTLDTALAQAERQLNSLTTRPTEAAAATLTTTLNTLSTRIDETRRNVRGQYSNLETELADIDSAMNRMKWLMDQIAESPEIRLRDTEGPLAGSKAVWQTDGDEGPEGVLILTDQRLLFEQKEEIVTKKFLGIIKTDSEMVQKLLLDVPAGEIESVSASEEGGFLGLGKDEILELVLGPSASVSRARFHLKGQDSAEWTVLLKQVQTGEVDQDRSEAFTEDVKTAAAVAASFPTQCTGCLAAVPTPARGAISVTCEYCGTVMMPQSAA